MKQAQQFYEFGSIILAMDFMAVVEHGFTSVELVGPWTAQEESTL